MTKWRMYVEKLRCTHHVCQSSSRSADALTRTAGVPLGGLPQRADQIALLAPEAELGADAEQRREHHALDQPPGVEVHLVLEPGVTGGIGRRQIVDLDRRSVGQDDAPPDQQGARLSEGDDAVIATDQASALRD